MMKGRKITVGQGLVMALFFLVFLDLLLALNYHAKKLVTNEEEQFEEDASIIDVEGTMPTTKAMIIIKDNANNHGREEQYLNNTKVLELMKHKFKVICSLLFPNAINRLKPFYNLQYILAFPVHIFVERCSTLLPSYDQITITSDSTTVYL
jgi:hypothetical protein